MNMTLLHLVKKQDRPFSADVKIAYHYDNLAKLFMLKCSVLARV